MERDKQGRFAKGASANPDKKITSANAREMQRKAAEARKANRSIAETLRTALEEKISKESPMTKREYLIAKALANASKDETLSFRDIAELQKILGESVQNVNVTGDPKVVEMTQGAIDALSKWSGK